MRAGRLDRDRKWQPEDLDDDAALGPVGGPAAPSLLVDCLASACAAHRLAVEQQATGQPPRPTDRALSAGLRDLQTDVPQRGSQTTRWQRTWPDRDQRDALGVRRHRRGTPCGPIAAGSSRAPIRRRCPPRPLGAPALLIGRDVDDLRQVARAPDRGIGRRLAGSPRTRGACGRRGPDRAGALRLAGR